MGTRLVDENVRWLGSLAWYTISDHEPIAAAQLLTWADDLALELVSRPTPRTADAFKTATSGFSRQWDIADGVSCELEFKQVKATDDVVVRHLFRNTVDSRAGRSSRDKVAEVKFHRPTKTHTGRRRGSEQITHRIAPNLDAETHAQVEAAMQDVHAEYASRIAYLNEGTLRKTIRDILDVRMIGLPLRRSGVYFILPEHIGTLDKLAELVSRLGSSCSLHYLPLVDDPKQRALLSDALAAETVALAESISSAVRDAGGTLPARSRTVLGERLTAQEGKVAQLNGELGIASKATSIALAEAREALLLADPVYRRRIETSSAADGSAQ